MCGILSPRSGAFLSLTRPLTSSPRIELDPRVRCKYALLSGAWQLLWDNSLSTFLRSTHYSAPVLGAGQSQVNHPSKTTVVAQLHGKG